MIDPDASIGDLTEIYLLGYRNGLAPADMGGNDIQEPYWGSELAVYLRGLNEGCEAAVRP